MIRVTRRYRFSASHRLHSDRFSDRENQELYGKCNNPFGHGHNYVLEIATAGEIDRQSGQVVNLRALDGLVRRTVLDRFDYRDLNRDVPELAGIVPTSENIASEIRRMLADAWTAQFGGTPRLESVRLRETRKNSFELRNEE